MQEIITPSDLESEIISELDRPYVGFLGLSSGWSYIKNDSGIQARLLLGIAGRASGAGGFQRWYHNVNVILDAPAWVGEMENSIHFNMYVSYLYEWQLAPNPFSIYIAVRPELSFGTRDIYVYPELVAYFGRRNPTASSMIHMKKIFFIIFIRSGFYAYSQHGEKSKIDSKSIAELVKQFKYEYQFNTKMSHLIMFLFVNWYKSTLN